jgi:hypothetical protein
VTERREWTVVLGGAETTGEDDCSLALDVLIALDVLESALLSSYAHPTGICVDRIHGLRIEVFAREHPPPHFRVSIGHESANYRISDCSQLNGGLQREYSVIRDWHRAHKLLVPKILTRSIPEILATPA